jgi:hypothetical protein
VRMVSRQDVFSTGVGFRDHVFFRVKLESNFGDATQFGSGRARTRIPTQA